MPFINVQSHIPLSQSIEKALQEYVKRDKRPFTSHLWGTRHFFEKHSAIRAGETGYQVVEEITVFPFTCMVRKDRETLMQTYDPSISLKDTTMSRHAYRLFHNSRWKHVNYNAQRHILDALVEKTRGFVVKQENTPGSDLASLFIAENEVSDRRMQVPSMELAAVLPLYTSSEWMNVEQTTYSASQQTRLKKDLVDGRVEKRDELHARGRVTSASGHRSDISILVFSQTFDSFFAPRDPSPKELKKSPNGNVKKFYGAKTWKTWKKQPNHLPRGDRPSEINADFRSSQYGQGKGIELPMWEFGDLFADGTDVTCDQEDTLSPVSIVSNTSTINGNDNLHESFIENESSSKDLPGDDFGFF